MPFVYKLYMIFVNTPTKYNVFQLLIDSYLFGYIRIVRSKASCTLQSVAPEINLPANTGHMAGGGGFMYGTCVLVTNPVHMSHDKNWPGRPTGDLELDPTISARALSLWVKEESTLFFAVIFCTFIANLSR